MYLEGEAALLWHKVMKDEHSTTVSAEARTIQKIYDYMNEKPEKEQPDA